MDEIYVGQYSLPVILSVFLGIVFKIWASIPDRFKSLVALAIGTILGIVAMYYNREPPFTIQVWIDHILFGFMAGAGAVGLYEASRSVYNSRASEK